MIVLVTGASGFIGNAVAGVLAQNKGLRVILTDIVEPHEKHGCDFLKLDLTSNNDLGYLPNVDVVYHLCAYNNTAHFYTKPHSVIKNTLTPTLNIINRYKNNAEKIVYTSSSEIYAGLHNQGLLEIPTPEVNQGMIDAIDNPRWSYAGSKLMGELALHAAHIEHGVEYVNIRPHNVYGARQRAHFIPEYAERIKQGDNVLYGADQTRAFLYIDDAAELIVRLANTVVNDTVNLGHPNETSIQHVASMIRDILQIKADPVFESAPEGSVQRRCADVSRMLDYVGEFEFIDLRSGLEKTLL
jgi:nucleoside-diphosphate-sugar epimerase